VTPHATQSRSLSERVAVLHALAEKCALCPHHCAVNRLKGERGDCGGGRWPSLMSYGPHHGEEVYLSGSRGSGTLFFGHCHLHCVYCQNADISQNHKLARLHEKAPEIIAEAMLYVQSLGCHNVNLVSPTHNVNGIVEAIAIAQQKGLRLPVVYNTHGYESVEVLQLLDGIVDTYLPDLKYADNKIAQRFGAPPDYVVRARAAIVEMHRQVGELKVGSDGLARQGVLIRHLVLPNNLAGSFETLRWIRQTLGCDVTVNIMAQYHPSYRAAAFNELQRPLSFEEYRKVVDYASSLGLRNILVDRYALHRDEQNTL